MDRFARQARNPPSESYELASQVYGERFVMRHNVDVAAHAITGWLHGRQSPSLEFSLGVGDLPVSWTNSVLAPYLDLIQEYRAIERGLYAETAASLFKTRDNELTLLNTRLERMADVLADVTTQIGPS